MNAAAFVLRLGLAAVFIYAGAVKAPAPARFAVDIESYQILPASVAALAAFYLPYLEIVAGMALLVPRVVAGGALLLGGLTGVFLVALLSAWARGLEIRCGCFGAGEAASSSYAWWMIRDALLLAACAEVLRRAIKRDDANQRA